MRSGDARTRPFDLAPQWVYGCGATPTANGGEMACSNTLTDAVEMLDGRLATIESGSAYRNHWNYSGFSGEGFLVCVEGEPVAGGQVAFRRDALRLVRFGRPVTPHTQAAFDAFAPEWSA